MNARIGFVALFAADLISTLGTFISMVSIPWLVLVATGSPAKMGGIAVAELVPYLISSVFAPPLADRYGIRVTSIWTDLASFVAMGVVAATPHLGYSALVALMAVIGAMRGISERTKHVMLQPVVEAAGMTMIRVTGAYETLNRTAQMFGAPLGGLMIYWFSVQGAIWLDAISFALCGLLVGLFVRLPERPADPQKAREPYLTALRAGFRHLVSDRVLVAMISAMFVLNMFSQAGITVFIPLWITDGGYSTAALGMVLGALAVGGVLGSVAFTVAAPRLPRRLVFVVGVLFAGTPRVLALGLSHSLPVVLVVTFLSGIALACANPVYGAMLYDRVPPELQTRVFGVVIAAGFAGLPIGGVLAGWAVTGLGLHSAILLGAAVCAVLSVAALVLFRRATMAAPVAASASSPR